jgi:hypothetical protein
MTTDNSAADRLEALALGGNKEGFMSAQALGTASGPCTASAAQPLTPGAQAALDYVWRAIDALGGTYSPEDKASGYAEAHMAALDAACAAVESLGARQS